ncbi:hypothetical protein CVT24_011293 [Panaeolus cyanescens]|uniref:Uncharacterized protein n=1 Tax=Panaeolus cyanescens TaxID=181874 RepID=A0A409YUY5_9AGAR|nr:hypothetical protein CVT24_011293 [Panaeolus cyanescens]
MDMNTDAQNPAQTTTIGDPSKTHPVSTPPPAAVSNSTPSSSVHNAAPTPSTNTVLSINQPSFSQSFTSPPSALLPSTSPPGPSSETSMLASQQFANSIPRLSLAADITPITTTTVAAVTGNMPQGPVFSMPSDSNRAAINPGIIVGGIIGGLFVVALLLTFAACRRLRKSPSGQPFAFGFPGFIGCNRRISPFELKPSSHSSKSVSLESVDDDAGTHGQRHTDPSSKSGQFVDRPPSIADIPPSYVP